RDLGLERLDQAVGDQVELEVKARERLDWRKDCTFVGQREGGESHQDEPGGNGTHADTHDTSRRGWTSCAVRLTVEQRDHTSAMLDRAAVDPRSAPGILRARGVAVKHQGGEVSATDADWGLHPNSGTLFWIISANELYFPSMSLSRNECSRRAASLLTRRWVQPRDTPTAHGEVSQDPIRLR